jgi:hypothetical protein
VLKSNGWRWGRSISAWYVPFSRDKLPKSHIITRSCEALRRAGFEVEKQIDQTSRPTAEVEADKIVRQENRVDALEAKAERLSAAEDAAWEREYAALERLSEGGEPIHVGHHSENRHRNAIAKVNCVIRKAIQASDDVTTAQARADTATHTTDARYRPVTVANRIQTLAAEIRRVERCITGDTYDSEIGYRPATDEEKAERTRRFTAPLDELREKHAYWTAVRLAQVENGKAANFSKDTIRKGDQVRIRGHWRVVVRAITRTVSVSTDYSWTDTAPYAGIQAHRSSAE